MSLAHLKSGTDIRGTAMGENNELSDEVIRAVIAGFVVVLEKKTGVRAADMRVSVGCDSRLSSERIKKAVIEQLLASGADVGDCGMSSTPAMFLTTVKKGYTGAVQITASHHPADKNGLKFFTAEGGFEGEDIAEILSIAERFDASPYRERGEYQSVDYMSEYAHDLRVLIREGIGADDFRHPLRGFSVAVDAGNGVGGFYALHVLKPLGADISGSRYLDPDGRFPNHSPNPENEEAMHAVSRAVLESGADLGVIFDTDVDRAACVDRDGREINRNRLIALASAIVLEKEKGATIVTDSVTSDGLASFINETLGGCHYRYRRGYKNVINEAIRLNREGVNCPLAMETSGHAALRENYFLDDGAYLMTKLIIRAAQMKKQGKCLSDLISGLEEPYEAKEIRLHIQCPDFKAYGSGVIDDLTAWAKKQPGVTLADDNREGVRFSFDPAHGDGWALLRLSVHDPVLPLNIESAKAGGVQQIEDQLSEFFQAYDQLKV